MKLTPGVDFTKLCQAKRRWRTAFDKKNCHSISPTKFKPNFCAEICQICVPKKASHPVQGKNSRAYVDESNPERKKF